MKIDRRKKYIITEVHKSSHHYANEGSWLIGKSIKIVKVNKPMSETKGWLCLNFLVIENKETFVHACNACKIK